MKKGGAFCEIYGLSIHNLVLEYLLENRDLDFAVGDLARNTRISRPKAYETIKGFEKKGLVRKSRVMAKTQLYILNKSNDKVKLFIKDFNECLKLVTENEKPTLTRHSTSAGIAYARQA